MRSIDIALAPRDFQHLAVLPRMFLFISHLDVPEDDRSSLEQHFRERARLVDTFPGFLYLQVLRPQAGSAAFSFLSAWESREAFAAYMRSDAHAVSREREPHEIMARTSVRHEAFDVLIDSREEMAN
jgi:heme-degrading monooxygenase HmoA